uniref:Uncharacterized protein n=1 Tax=Cacopsylla melanoneura TaxID=428564 RepID=A0A8D8XFG1_9HEMI
MSHQHAFVFFLYQDDLVKKRCGRHSHKNKGTILSLLEEVAHLILVLVLFRCFSETNQYFGARKITQFKFFSSLYYVYALRSLKIKVEVFKFFLFSLALLFDHEWKKWWFA